METRVEYRYLQGDHRLTFQIPDVTEVEWEGEEPFLLTTRNARLLASLMAGYLYEDGLSQAEAVARVAGTIAGAVLEELRWAEHGLPPGALY